MKECPVCTMRFSDATEVAEHLVLGHGMPSDDAFTIVVLVLLFDAVPIFKLDEQQVVDWGVQLPLARHGP